MRSFNPSLDEYLRDERQKLQLHLTKCKLEELADPEFVAHEVETASVKPVKLNEPPPAPTVTEKPDGILVEVAWEGNGAVDQFYYFEVEPRSEYRIYARGTKFSASNKFPKDVELDEVRGWVKTLRQVLAGRVETFNIKGQAHNAELQVLAERIVSERRAVGNRAEEIARGLEDL